MTRATVGRFWGIRGVAAFVALAAVATACVPPSDPSGPTPIEEFCELWEKVDESPPTTDTAVLVKEDVVALAEETDLIGQDCTQSGARIELDGAVLAEGKEVPASLLEGELEGAVLAQGSDLEAELESDPDTIAAITGQEIAPGEAVLENVSLRSLSADITSNGIRLRGNVAVRLSGVTSTIGFVGTLSSLNSWSVSLSSTALTIPGITSSPASFNGTLNVRSGVPTLTMSARATSARIGDITVTGAEIDLTASPATGVAASVKGAIKVGPSTVNGTVDVEFDTTGALVSAQADLSAHLVGQQADGKMIDLQGTVKLDGNAQETVASFSASGIVGDLEVIEANGDLTLETNKATFVGKLDVVQGPNTVRFNGAIVWDGITAFTPFLTLEGAGEISGVLADGKRVAANGTIEATVIGNQTRAVLTGEFALGTLNASGSAVIEYNGASTVLEVDAELVDAGFDARLEGAVVITDGRVEMVNLDASVRGELNFGDATLTNANLSVRSSFGSPLDLSFSGGVKVGSQANLEGSVDASFGPNGQLIRLRGDVRGSMALDSWALVNFNGTVVATSEQVSVSGSGGVLLANFPAGLTMNGTLTSSLENPSWSLNGTARFRIGSLDIASARMRLSQEEGMKATRVGFYFSIIGIGMYFEGDFYMNPGGGCDRVDITAGGPIAKLILVTTLPNAIGCPVYI